MADAKDEFLFTTGEYLDCTPPTEEDFRRLGEWHDYWTKVPTPVYCGPAEVWAMAMTKGTPVYAIYDCGTNCIRLLERNKGTWTKLNSFKDVDNLTGLMYHLICTISFLQRAKNA